MAFVNARRLTQVLESAASQRFELQRDHPIVALVITNSAHHRALGGERHRAQRAPIELQRVIACQHLMYGKGFAGR
jgi:hypothetical protein